MRNSAPKGERTSALLRQIMADLPEAEVQVGVLVRQLRRRSFGGVFIVLGLLAILPGISIFAGLAMIVPAVQLALGFRAARFPRFIRERRIATPALREAMGRVLPWMERVERYVKPRWEALASPPMPMLVGLITIALTGVIMLPLPLSNLPPAIALLCLALGLVERDGVLILAGLLLAALAFVIGAVMAVSAWELLMLAVDGVDGARHSRF